MHDYNPVYEIFYNNTNLIVLNDIDIHAKTLAIALLLL